MKYELLSHSPEDWYCHLCTLPPLSATIAFDSIDTTPAASAFDSIDTTPAASAFDSIDTTPAVSAFDCIVTTPVASAFDSIDTTPATSAFDCIDTTPVASAFDSIDTTPVASAFDSIDTTPAASEFDSIDNTPAASAFDSIDTTPAASAFDSIDTTPAASAFDSIDNTPAASAFDSIDNTPAASASDSIDNTPAASAFDSIDNTPAASAFNSIDNTPAASAFDSIDNTPAASAFDSIDNTPAASAFDSIDTTPAASAFDSIDTTPAASADHMFDVFHKRGIHILHLNIRSLLSKIDELRYIAIKSRATVICITETWLDETVWDPDISIPEYKLLRKDRNRDWGGVCMYIRSDIPHRVRIDFQHPELETVWAEILLPKTRPILKSRATVICITETWLDETVWDPEISIPEYKLLRKDRNRDGGGVCMYIRSDIPHRVRIDFQHPELETVWAEILLPKTRPILVGTCYRPPKQMNFYDLME